MAINPYLLLIFAILILGFCLDALTDGLNLRALRPGLPKEFEGVFEPERYRKALDYQAEGIRFGILRRAVMLALLLAFIALGGFPKADALARSIGARFGSGEIPTGLAFAAILGVLQFAVSLPFSLYDTFVIEEKFGFN